MTDVIEIDALANTPAMSDAHPISDAHTHEIKSFIATPKEPPKEPDKGILRKALALLRGDNDLKPGMHITRKADDGLRTMFVVTSNSYQDREFETITSQALKDYEASCFPGDGLFHCENPYVYWHDDDAPMGEIIAVNYSEPFLIEIVKELPTPFAKIMWDYAEENGDNAGSSHRFGYLEKDRSPDGTFTRIFKQETSYLPDRSLAANAGTYAGVITPMATQQSDAWLDKIILERTGGAIKDAAKKLHARTGVLDKELAELDIQHKAQKPPMPPKADMPMPNPGTVAEVEADEEVEEDAKEGRTADMTTYLAVIEQITSLVMDLVDAQQGIQTEIRSLKEYRDEAKEKQMTEKSVEQKAQESVEARLKAIEGSIATIKAQLAMTPRSVTQQKGETDPEAAKAAIDEAVKSAKEQDLVDTPFGKAKKTV